MDKKAVSVTLQLPQELFSHIEETAKRRYSNRAVVIREIIGEHVRREKSKSSQSQPQPAVTEDD